MMGLSMKFMVSYTWSIGTLILKKWMKKYFKLVGFSRFQIYFYINFLIKYDYNMKKLKVYYYIVINAPSTWKY
jgi:hypothetical protein